MSSREAARTEPPTTPVDPHERFADRLDDAPEWVPCPECGSERVDGWMTEGALSLVAVCCRCGHEWREADRLNREVGDQA